ncbi:predicted protein [Uncinocarpus reesii 1704]|uniref:Uncharacterized protein n=1 Tax=Uncinocarpus reesii (strain UAMH 1704) TaxID=336963 RepID=C4JWH4_UNCRE|nr:uncharacterized protein UREG_06916 [Uncinocarpus reesii 1704]EEP82051.1 predicted protein [Uncinocarpus reesii 1704]
MLEDSPFFIEHGDLSPQNIIVDSEYNITGRLILEAIVSKGRHKWFADKPWFSESGTVMNVARELLFTSNSRSATSRSPICHHRRQKSSTTSAIRLHIDPGHHGQIPPPPQAPPAPPPALLLLTTDTMSNDMLRSTAGLSDRFRDLQGRNQGEVWDDLWKESRTPWDRGAHNPALEDALVQKRGFLGPAVFDDGRRKKALVPGCGRGVDVFLLAAFGYDAYGLEYSHTALEVCLKETEKYYGENGRVPPRDDKVGSGKVTFLQGDFFKDDWLKDAGLAEGDFDLIYDYTFFCALNPTLRPQWALRHSQLLAPSPRGNLICLEFPTTKDPATLGPPFASTPAMYMEHLSHPGEDVAYDDKGYVKPSPLKQPSEKGLERVAHWQPERTHTVGMDDSGNVLDWVSIWRRRN